LSGTGGELRYAETRSDRSTPPFAGRAAAASEEARSGVGRDVAGGAPRGTGRVFAAEVRLAERERPMSSLRPDPRRRQALDRLHLAVQALADANASHWASAEEHERLLGEFRAAVDLAEDLLLLLEHQVRGPLTIVKGRAQLLRRHALGAPRPDVRLIAGLTEIDAAVGRIVAQLELLLDGPPASAPPVDPPASFEDGD
jgi:signal transduction histidine kinase